MKTRRKTAIQGTMSMGGDMFAGTETSIIKAFGNMTEKKGWFAKRREGEALVM